MKECIVLFVSIWFFLPASIAQQGQESPEPEGVFEFAEKRHNFGAQEEGPKISHDFVFTNVGEKPLVIKNVRASCGCTTPYWPKEPIMPGESNKITAVYNTKGRVGKFSKTITIEANTIPRLTNLKISGEVYRPSKEEMMPFKEKSILAPDGME